MAALNMPVTLSSSTSYEGIIVVNDDEDFEGDINERFGVQLSLLSGDVPDRVTIETSVLEIQIEDNEPRPGVYSDSSFAHCFLSRLQLLELDFLRVVTPQWRRLEQLFLLLIAMAVTPTQSLSLTLWKKGTYRVCTLQLKLCV